MAMVFNVIGAEGQVYAMKFTADKKNEEDSCRVHELKESIMATATYAADGDVVGE